MPPYEGFGFSRHAEVLVEPRGRLADLSLSALEEQPIAFATLAAGEVEADDDASLRKSVPAERIAHRPQSHKGVEVLWRDLEPARAPLAERLTHCEELVSRGR